MAEDTPRAWLLSSTQLEKTALQHGERWGAMRDWDWEHSHGADVAK